MIRRIASTIVLPVVVMGAVSIATAPTASAAACEGTSGVTVVVESPSGTTVSCALGDPTSGFDALARAGFGVTPVQRFPGALCRINGFPADQGCVVMPPATAYWAYWQASAGGSWSYSSAGAGSTNPAPGSVEGWRFGSGQAPSVPPPYVAPPAPPTTAPPAPNPPATTAPQNPGGGGGAVGGSGGSAPVTGGDVSGAAPGESSASTAPDAPTGSHTDSASASATASASAGGSPSPTSSASGLATGARSNPSSSGAGSGSVLSLVVGGALVLGLAAGAVAVARRRRVEVDAQA